MSRYLLAANGVVWVVVQGKRYSPGQVRAMMRHLPDWSGRDALLELADRADAAQFYPIRPLPDFPTRKIVT